MAALHEGTLSMRVQLSIVVPFIFLFLLRKPLLAKTKDLVSRTLHVRYLRFWNFQ